MIEYVLCYSAAFILGFTTAMLIMWVAVVLFERKPKKK